MFSQYQPFIPRMKGRPQRITARPTERERRPRQDRGMAVTALIISIIALLWSIAWPIWLRQREQPSVTIGLRRSTNVVVVRGTDVTFHIDVINRGGLDEEVIDVGFRSLDPSAGIDTRLGDLLDDYGSGASGPQLPCRIENRSSLTWSIDGAALAHYRGTPLLAYAVRREPASDKYPTGELHWTSTTTQTP